MFELELSHENIPVTWYRNDVKIHPSRTVVTRVDGKKHVLEINEVTLDDTCQIKAEAKGIPSMANLTVIGKSKNTCLSSSSNVSTSSYSQLIPQFVHVCVCPDPQNKVIVYL